MAEQRRRAFSEEFKRSAIDRVLSGKQSLAQVARELKIDASLLHGWKAKLSQEETLVKATETLEEENRRLRRENASLREDREILKKKPARSLPRKSREVRLHRDAENASRRQAALPRLCVSAAAFYDWRSGPLTEAEGANQHLSSEITRIHREGRGIYGRSRIHAELKASGYHIGVKRV